MSNDDEQLDEIRLLYQAEQNGESMTRIASTLAQYRDALTGAGFAREEAMILVCQYHDWMLNA